MLDVLVGIILTAAAISAIAFACLVVCTTVKVITDMLKGK